MSPGIEGKHEHDWVKARAGASAEAPVESASQKEIARAREIADRDILLADDPWTKEVLDNGGVVTIETTNEEVAVDLEKFLAARRHFLNFERVKSLDPVVAQIAQQGPEQRDLAKSLH
jgi:hypothetical protein